MANIYTVKKGDTLSEIAYEYYGTYGKGFDSFTAYLARIIVLNDIKNPDYIVVGQKIKLGGDVSPSPKPTTYIPTITQFGLISDDASEHELFVKWDFNNDNISHYVIAWQYSTNAVKWLDGTGGSEITTTNQYYTFTPPSNAVNVRVKVKPVSKTKKVNGRDTHYWFGQWCGYSQYSYDQNPPGAPSTPTVSIDTSPDYLETLTVALENIPGSLNAKAIQFYISIHEHGLGTLSPWFDIKDGRVSYVTNLVPGLTYSVACRAKNKFGTIGDYSPYTSEIVTAPIEVKDDKIRCTATSKTSIKVEWNDVGSVGKNATHYEMQYTTNKEYFTTSAENELTNISNIKTTVYEVTKLESGTEYFFRIRSANIAGTSAWSKPVSAIVGSSPTRPTTWSSNTTAIVGEPLYLYWVHNSSDNSAQKLADVEITANGETTIHTITADPDKEQEVGEINTFKVDTSSYSEGSSIKWRVRTAGVTNVYSEWSIERTVDVYSRPLVSMQLTDKSGNYLNGTVESFPVYISALASPNTQRPIGYHISIRYTEENEVYETVDQTGSMKIVRPGEEVYSKHFDVSDDAGELLVELTPGSVDFVSNGQYEITCTVAMNSGLTSETSQRFYVSWREIEYSPNAEIVIDEDAYSANIRPFCEGYTKQYFTVVYDTENDIYTVDESSELDLSSDAVRFGQILSEVYTETWEEVYVYENDSTKTYFCERFSEEQSLIEDVTLSIYRREYDGSFTEIQSGIQNDGATWAVDPHPALDQARYRIVSVSKTTGAISYCDLPGYPIRCTSVIIQWDEAWSSFDNDSEDSLVTPTWAGSLLKLPYNINVSNKNNRDVVLVEYIGRKHPVSYYGTQLGESASWSVEIPKSDTATLYALRRLAIWSGDVYVREPSGSGYWANITVSFSQKHKEVTIPVTLEIVRVEGGV